jgi:hypothetical protein
MDRPGPIRVRPAVHRTVVVVDVERFGDRSRTNPHRLVVREALYGALKAALAESGIGWADCHHEDRGDGVLVLVPPEVAKSVLVERLPVALMDLLDGHNATHSASEQIRLRMAIHAGEIFHDAHGVVSAAVNLTYRLVDSAELRRALDESAASLALITSNWFYNEVILHSLSDEAAAYRPVRVLAKETDTTAWIRVSTPQPTSAQPAVSHPGNIQLLWTASDESARRLGARRTAYPLDLSIAELHDRGLYVPATFAKTTPGADSLTVVEIAREVGAGSSVLILGEPGSGKSVASYALLRQLRQQIPAIAVRVSDLRKGLAFRPAEDSVAPQPVLVIDGLDETLGDFESAADLSELLHQLSTTCTLVVTCRRREFEDSLANSSESGVFDSIYAIGAWTLADQFTEFVTRLVAVGLLDSHELLDAVGHSPGLAGMVVRPLYARMLTYLRQDRLPAVRDVSSLYAEYIDALAAASDTALARAKCRMPVSSSEVWTEAAWQIFARSMLHDDRFDFGAVVTAIEARTGEEARCLSRALSQICDQWRAAGHEWGRFVHYSFFEYLVSRHYVRQLTQAMADGTTTALIECLTIDPSPEIRHFVVAELRIAPVPRLADALEQAYLLLRETTVDLPRARTTGNLIAYLLSRAAHDARATLRRLLDGENDMFLRQSLLWGLCHLGDSGALAEFVRESRHSAEWRAWNRGYLMYYYGDIDRRADPPYVDVDRRRGWGRTRERSIALMSATGYHRTIPAQRRYLDLYILYDYAVWRNELLAGTDAGVAGNSLEALWNDPALEGSLLQELQAMHAVVCR